MLRFSLVILVMLVTSQNSALGEKLLDPAMIKYNNQILNARPKLLKDDGRPKASVGTVLYVCNSEMQPFLLIGQESSSKTGGDTYCELGGSMELDDSNKSETFLEGCIRECKEESGGLYRLDPEYVLSNSYTYHNISPSQREEVYIFIKAPHYHTANDLLTETKKHNEFEYKEKSDFKWVALSDLQRCDSKNKCDVHDIDGQKSKIQLRKYFYKAMTSPKVGEILGQICSS